MVKNNYLELDKATLSEWVDKALLQSSKKETIKFRFKVCWIQPLNLVIMVGNIGPIKVFTIAKEEGVENAY